MATQRICSIADCGKPHLARGWCGKHYRQYQVLRRGPCRLDGCERPQAYAGLCDPHYSRSIKGIELGPIARRMRGQPAAEAAAFLERAAFSNAEACIDWPYLVDAYGYGVWWEMGFPSPRKAHRVACEMAHGPAPEGRPEAAHRCGRAICTNGSHLRWSNNAENIADKFSHDTWGKLKKSQVLEIRQRAESGEIIADLAKEYGVSKSAIRAVVSRKTWATL